MYNKLTSCFILTAFAMTIASCSTDSVPGEQPQVGVSFNTVHSSTFDVQAKMSQIKMATPGTFVFSSGHIAINRLEFEVEAENDSIEIEFELEQNTLIDFATGLSNPDINTVSIPAGVYEEVEIEIELNNNYDLPAVVMNGVYTAPDGAQHPVRFEFNSEETFEVEREGIITFTEDQRAITQITIDPTIWFAEVTDEMMANAVKDVDGIIVVSEEINSEIFDTVADGLDLASEVEVSDDEEEDDEEIETEE